MTKLERIHRAIRNGEVLRIRYHGGTQPGSTRDIRPIRMTDKWNGCLIEADCLQSGHPKSFYLERMNILEMDSLPVTYTPVPEHLRNDRSPFEQPKRTVEIIVSARVQAAAEIPKPVLPAQITSTSTEWAITSFFKYILSGDWMESKPESHGTDPSDPRSDPEFAALLASYKDKSKTGT